MTKLAIRRGDVFWAKLDKIRPCVIVSNNKYNLSSENCIVCALSTSLKRTDLESHVTLSLKINDKSNICLTENIQSIEKKELLGYICTLSIRDMNRISKALVHTLEINYEL